MVKTAGKSKVWNFFTLEADSQGKCKICGSLVPRPRGNTKGMATHLLAHNLSMPSQIMADDNSFITEELVDNEVDDSQNPRSAVEIPLRVSSSKVIYKGYGFSYDKNSVDGDKMFWRCEKKGACSARLHTSTETGEVLRRINHHTHTPYADVNAVAMSYGTQQTTTVKEMEPVDSTQSPTTSLSQISLRADVDPSVHQFLKKTLNRNTPKTVEERMADEFWSIFEVTKTVVDTLQREANRSSCAPITFASADVKKFMKQHRFMPFSAQLSKFTLRELKLLTKKECRLVLEHEGEGIRLYYALKCLQSYTTSQDYLQQMRKANTPPTKKVNQIQAAPSQQSSVHESIPREQKPLTTGPIRVYMSAEDGTEIYQMVTLSQLTARSLKTGLMQRPALKVKEYTKICMKKGPIVVEICDAMIEGWKNEDTFLYQMIDGIFVLKHVVE